MTMVRAGKYHLSDLDSTDVEFMKLSVSLPKSFSTYSELTRITKEPPNWFCEIVGNDSLFSAQTYV